jgi:hypothetical protein
MADPDDFPISLRTLFILMGLVTTALIAGVVYTKLYGQRHMSVAEQRAVDRVCDTNCASLARVAAERTPDPVALEAFARRCVADCQARQYAVIENTGQSAPPPPP